MTALSIVASTDDRLDRVVTAAMPALSRAQVRRLIEAGRVQVEGVTTEKSSTTVAAGTHIEVDQPLLPDLDLAAGEQARQVAPHLYVTKILHEVDFIAPVQVGDTVSYYTEVTRIGKTSVTIRVLVEALRGVNKREVIKVTEAEVVMVAVNKKGKPIPIRMPTGMRKKGR